MKIKNLNLNWQMFRDYIIIYIFDYNIYLFTRDTFHSNLRKTDVFPLKAGAPKWKKERSKTAIRRYRL